MKKFLSIGIIVLFIGMSISSSTGFNLEKQYSLITLDGNTLYVGGTGEGNYTKIQDAIDNASDGDTIFVFDDSSPYNENLIVDKSIKLIGEDWKTTIINGINIEKSVIHISDDWVNISGFTIRNGYSGIRIYSNNNTITGNIILDNVWGGVTLRNAKGNNITGNKISNNLYGIQLYNRSSYNYISRNIILKNDREGIIFGNPIVPLLLIDTSNYGFDNCDFNIIIKNTLINYHNAFFIGSWKNTWIQNYWNRPRILPKLIFGYKGDYTNRWINIDWRPAKEPYDI